MNGCLVEAIQHEDLAAGKVRLGETLPKRWQRD